jgi:hypothetical protein
MGNPNLVVLSESPAYSHPLYKGGPEKSPGSDGHWHRRVSGALEEAARMVGGPTGPTGPGAEDDGGRRGLWGM